LYVKKKHDPYKLACKHILCTLYLNRLYNLEKNTIICPVCNKTNTYHSIYSISKVPPKDEDFDYIPILGNFEDEIGSY